MKQVLIISGPHANKTAIMRADGRVQLACPTDAWKSDRYTPDNFPMCFGWHDPEGETTQILP